MEPFIFIILNCLFSRFCDILIRIMSSNSSMNILIHYIIEPEGTHTFHINPFFNLKMTRILFFYEQDVDEMIKHIYYSYIKVIKIYLWGEMKKKLFSSSTISNRMNILYLFALDKWNLVLMKREYFCFIFLNTRIRQAG